MAPFSVVNSSPLLNFLVARADAAGDEPGSVAGLLESQWRNPSDILSVLMLLGPDIVQKAIAQTSGRAITPVAFSFGWVAYAAASLLRVFGDGRLMPDADMTNTMVIGAVSSHSRTTKSWVLGRLLRDEDDRVDEEMKREQDHVPPNSTAEIHKGPPPAYQDPNATAAPTPEWEALRVTVYEVDDNPPVPHGVPTLDRVWFSGIVVIVVQLVVSTVPWIISADWGIFLVTAAGTVLALLNGSLPQWREEKWACTKKGGATVTITQGNGSRHAIVILGKKGVGLDLEILAIGTRTASPSAFTRVASAVLALFWIVLLVVVAGLNENSWYLLAVGLLGGVQNLHAAGASRKPSALGIHLKKVKTVRDKRVAAVLKRLEETYSTVGTSLVPVFFPGGLRVNKGDDLNFWQSALKSRLAPNRYGTRIDDLGNSLIEGEVAVGPTEEKAAMADVITQVK
ncbi:RDD domain-containing protein [Madurella fahalii]|uniref:RDD domain-containing protein n=1 Tax=Madurella fahalii TaxID=1157608 RepID=A0ABQ0GNE9_9PEZI